MKIVKDKIKVITKEAKWTSWAELKALSEAGKLSKVLKSGDNIPVTLKNGEEVSFDIGKDEDGKIYFVMHNCLKESRPINRGWTNKGGWEESDVRRYLNEEVIELLPDELRKIIKPTKIVQVWNDKRRETEDKLFLLSRTQVFGKHENYEAIEPSDSQIDIFENPRERVKECKELEEVYYWWLRSPYSVSSSNFCSVGVDGTVYDLGAGYSFEVTPAFCI